MCSLKDPCNANTPTAISSLCPLRANRMRSFVVKEREKRRCYGEDDNHRHVECFPSRNIETRKMKNKNLLHINSFFFFFIFQLLFYFIFVGRSPQRFQHFNRSFVQGGFKVGTKFIYFLLKKVLN